MLDTFNSSHQHSFWSNFISIFLFFGSRRYCIFSTLNKLLLLLLLLKVIFDIFAERFVYMFFRSLNKNGKEETSCGEKCLLNKTLHISIYNYLLFEWIHLKESRIIMLLVLSAVKELL